MPIKRPVLARLSAVHRGDYFYDGQSKGSLQTVRTPYTASSFLG